jgi:hypothetical protein
VANRWDSWIPGQWPGVDEAWLWEVIPPLGRCFIGDWVRYMAPLTQGNMAYHTAVAISAMSSFVPISIFFPNGDRLRANVYFLLVGDSTISKKTHSIKTMGDIFGEVAPSRLLGLNLSSPEGIIEEITISGQRISFMSEGSDMIQNTVEGYAKTLRSMLNTLYDCSQVTRTTLSGKKKNKDQVLTQKDPRYSLVMGCTPADLESYTYKFDWRGGFIPRFCLVYAKPGRVMEGAGTNDKLRNEMVTLLTRLNFYFSHGGGNGMTVGPCMGFTREAMERYLMWVRAHPTSEMLLDDGERACVSRSEGTAIKSAMILRFDRLIYDFICADPKGSVEGLKAALQEPWYVETEDVEFGCRMGDIHQMSARHLIRSIGETEDSRLFRKITIFLKDGPQPLFEIYRKLALNEKKAESILKSMESMRCVIRIGPSALNGVAAIRDPRYYLIDSIPKECVEEFTVMVNSSMHLLSWDTFLTHTPLQVYELLKSGTLKAAGTGA